jgi:hypothetical protein
MGDITSHSMILHYPSQLKNILFWYR